MTKSTHKRSLILKVAGASLTGTSIEWFDFFLYNAAMDPIFKPLFFSGSGLSDNFNLYVTYAVGFFARPVGGMVCGHFGDRKGRKSMLVLTLLITGLATFCIGLLYPYQSMGIAAPLLLALLRFAQGFGIGGEWGGAVLMPVEYAPAHRRGFYGSLPQLGVPIGLFSYIVMYWLVKNLPAKVHDTNLWRVPFLLSIVLVGIGLYIRKSVPESPLFDRLEQYSKFPAMDLWRRQRRAVLLAMGAKLAENGIFYLYTVFIVSFGTTVNIERVDILWAVSLAALLLLVTIPLYGILSDKFGRRPIYLFGSIFAGLFAFPSFWMIETGSTGQMTLAIVLAMAVGWAAMYAPQASFFSEIFPTQMRYSGASLGAQVATIFAGGLMVLIAERLLALTHSYWPVALIIVVMSGITTIAVFLTPETARKEIGPGC